MNRYEALGRYTLAVKQFATALTKRNDQLEDIARLCNGTAGRHQARVSFKALRLMVEVAEQLEIEVRAAIADANAVAPKASQPPLNLQENPHVD